jgi:hypothetical protein
MNLEDIRRSTRLHETIVEDIALTWFGEHIYALAHRLQLR